MKPSHRREILTLLEAVLEGQASSVEIARLEQLVLSDGDCMQLYLSYMQMHGNLYWDAAGRGVESVEEPSILQPKSHRSIKTIVPALLATAALLFFSLLILRSPAVQTQPESVIAESAPSENNSTDLNLAPAVNENEIVQLHLPRNGSNAGEKNGATDTPMTLGETKPALRFDSDNDVVSLINSEIQNQWETFNISPSQRASDSEWVRRVHLDLAGRIPNSLEVETFLNDSKPDKRQRLVDSLLESRDFATHFASMWTTLLVGRSRNEQIDREELFAYMQRQFGNNDSWATTVTDLISAEGPADDSGPSNFLLAHLNNEAVPATSITTRIFLCQQIQCSQCHRHPDASAWGQEKFWEFNAFFQNTSVKEEVLVDQETGESRMVRKLIDHDASQREPTYYEDLHGVMKVAYPRFASVDVEPQANLTLRQQLAALLTSSDDHQLARGFVNRNWKHFFGFAFTREVDDMGPHHPGSHPQLLEALSEAFVASDYNVRRLLRWICLSEPYQLSSQPTEANEIDSPETGDSPLFSRMYLKPLSPEQLFNSLLIASGATSDELFRQRNAYAQREEWLQQFFTAVENEENGELSTFDGSLPQTLMMMNGNLTKQAIDPLQGQVLREIVTDRNRSETKRIEDLCLAALARYPTRQELESIRKMLRSQVRHQTTFHNIPAQVAYHEALRDVYWAYLNSSEFSVNH